MSLIFHLRKNDGGFYCQMWKLASNYLYSKKQKLHFFIDDSQWMFTHNLGWRDYFKSLTLVSETKVVHPIHKELNVENILLNQFTLFEYIEAFKVIYILNDSLKEQYLKKKILLPTIYNSIMIRRGDKMYGESIYIDTHEYIKKLLDKNSSDIYVQTDDYTAYEEVCNICKKYYNTINVFTFCPVDKKGAFVFSYNPGVGSSISDNNTYLNNLLTITQKSVQSYSSVEMKEHVEEMIIGLELCMNSEYLSTDFQSNVTRFLLCTHKNPENVFYVGSIPTPPLNKCMVCPAKGFIIT